MNIPAKITATVQAFLKKLSTRTKFIMALAVLVIFAVAVQILHKPAAPKGDAATTETQNATTTAVVNDGSNIAPTEPQVLPTPTGNVADTVSMILDYSDKEDAAGSTESGDAAITVQDNAALDSFAAISENYSQTLDEATFCADASGNAARLKQLISDGQAQITIKQADRLSKLISRRNSRDNDVIEIRSEFDGLRASFFEKMLERAQDDTEKQAVYDFQQAVEAAVKAKRDALAGEKDAFRKSVDQLITQRNEKISGALDAYTKTTDTAVGAAANGCGSGTTAVGRLKSDLKAADNKFLADKNAVESLDPAGLAAADDNNSKKAHEMFHAAVAEAGDDLSFAFKEI